MRQTNNKLIAKLMDLDVVYGGDAGLALLAYDDSDWVEDTTDRKTTLAFSFCIAGVEKFAVSKKTAVAASSYDTDHINLTAIKRVYLAFTGRRGHLKSIEWTEICLKNTEDSMIFQ